MEILVVEDEATIADFIVRGLTEHGYAVDLARDGAAALDLLAADGLLTYAWEAAAADGVAGLERFASTYSP
ncbi:MAG TPA: hypothetical protein VF176_06325, partial [Solirubrobacterales bacterium]